MTKILYAKADTLIDDSRIVTTESNERIISTTGDINESLSFNVESFTISTPEPDVRRKNTKVESNST